MMTGVRLYGVAVVVVGGLLAACGGDGTPDPFAFEQGDDNGAAMPLTVPAGEARAGRIAEADLPADTTGLATWEANDFVLANERIAVLIEDGIESELYDPWAGKLVGVARNDGGSLVAAGDFNEVIIGVGRFTVKPERIAVLNDGTNGGTAIVRVIGVLRPIPFVNSLADVLFRQDYADIEVAVDYELAPGDDHVDVYYTLNNRTEEQRDFVKRSLLVLQTQRMPAYAEGPGFGMAMGTNGDYFGYVDEDNTSYAVSVPGQTLVNAVQQAGVQLISTNLPDGSPGVFSIPAMAQTRYYMARIYVGGEGNGLDGLRRSIARSEGETTRALTGTIRENGGGGAANARVHVLSADGMRYLTRARSDASGNYTVYVPEGEAVQLHAFRDGDGVATPVMVDASSTSAGDLTFPPAGSIHVTAQTMEPGAMAAAPAPVRVQIIQDSGSVPRPGTANVFFNAFGEQPLPQPDRLHVAFPTDGDVTLRAPVGDYRVVVSRGYEYDLYDAMHSVTADTTEDVPVTLNRDVDSTDVLCGDFHIHTNRSPDSEDGAENKIAYALGDGLELPVRTDHEHVAAFEPTIAAMGMQAWAFGVSAVEFTTFDYGHFGVFPVEPDSSRVNHGAPIWRDLSTEDPESGLARLVPAPEVFAEVTGRTGSPEVIIFHPRDGGAGFAYFNAVNYQPATGMVSDNTLWDESAFDIVEGFNDSSFLENADSTVTDWFSFLDRGHAVTMVGSSDSHDVQRGAPVGYPRTCVITGTDDPADFRTSLDSSDLRDMVLGGGVLISGGIFVTASATGGAGPGDTVTSAGATETISVTVQAPSWVPVDALEVYVNGVLDQTITIPATMSTVRLAAEPVMVNLPAGDSHVIFHARGPVDAMGVETADLAPVHPGRAPFGVTNAIFFSR